MLEAVLAQAYLVAQGDRELWIHYSRNNNRFGLSRYRSEAWTRTYTLSAIDASAAGGLLENRIAKRGTRTGIESTFRATDEMMQRLDGYKGELSHRARETIVLRTGRGDDRRSVDYEDNDRTRSMRREVQIVNEARKSVVFAIEGHGVFQTGRPVVLPIRDRETGILRDQFFGSWHSDGYRVFQEDFDHHGRFYGPWQSLPKTWRNRILIDGEPTVEIDLPSLHPSMISALAQYRLEGEPYDFGDCERSIAKKVFSASINGTSGVAYETARALAKRAGTKEWGDFMPMANTIISDMKKRHGPWVPYLGKGLGNTLMNIDSDMIMGADLDLLNRGVVGFSIHDSLLVKERHRADAVEILHDRLSMTLSRLSGWNGYVSGCHLKSVLQEAPGPSLPLCPSSASLALLDPSSFPASENSRTLRMRFILPEDQQNTLFPENSSEVSGETASDWNGGHIPSDLARSVYREQRRRGLKQAEVAALVGVSRPHLANILNGKFGASAETARSIRRFVLAEAITVRSFGLVAS
ncbi:helix-turn-helix domain-containing protein [Fulvimarina sp. 2208YS6-2-32]|uniref:Helix-turn-helix domain-containing protein n=1 Tax=Fulvimarina uroteuthidis TaxID=3098149 RepID=A0ABU5I7A8_9HYPH|nr:helix-turn-helix domain-containing protein [Fulvimarina sp. 2208YS6-2-32]MDY8111131.1 helix-turn-helix domain-containing protein [Fulvimarina sp. 2208YS6-2-32]